MSIEIRPLTAADYPAWIRAKFTGFGYTIPESQLLRTPVEIDRSLAAYDSGRIVGTINSHTFRLRIPGGWLPMAGVAGVTVQPTHRRRGLMTGMMNRQLRDMHERGEPATGLYASESIIYGRFGYGIATFHESWSIDRLRTQLIPGDSGAGRVEYVSRSEAVDLLPEVREKACYGRAGAIHRRAARWELALGHPEDQDRPDRTRLIRVVYRDGSSVEGYLLYRIRPRDQTVAVEELCGLNARARRALWQYCFGVDLMTTIKARHCPLEDPLLWMLADPRHLKRIPCDSLWLRLIDAPAALSARRYASEGRLVLELEDASCPWNRGRFELEGGPDGATCRPTSRQPDLELTANELGAVYLGGVSFRTLSRASRVQARNSKKLSEADAMFRVDVPPWCSEHF